MEDSLLTFRMQTLLYEPIYCLVIYKQCYVSYVHVQLQKNTSFAKSPISFLAKGYYSKGELSETWPVLVIVLVPIFLSID